MPGLLFGHGAGFTGRDPSGLDSTTAMQPYAMHVPSTPVLLEDIDMDQLFDARADTDKPVKTLAALLKVVLAVDRLWLAFDSFLCL